jgi:lysine 2,3-aminomutase
VPNRDWNDWRWQSRHRIRTLAEFDRFLQLSPEEREAMTEGGTMLPAAVTPYYMSLVDPADPRQPLRRTVVPTCSEFVRAPGEADDPLGEDGHSPVPGLVHRYPDRVLLLPLDFCSTYCRYCTRSRVVGHGEIMPNERRLRAAFDYLRGATDVRDVLVSGGDPLALSEDRLDWILRELRSIPHIEFVRIGTKMPAVLPQRVTRQLCRVLRRYHPLWMSLHFVHPDECTPEAAQACGRLADAGIPLGSQTVLLKGVNDSVETIRELVHRLLLMRVRPYYLYQCDPISGSSHFRTPISKGLEIIDGLRGHTTGYAVPTYVIDAPGGGGKRPITWWAATAIGSCCATTKAASSATTIRCSESLFPRSAVVSPCSHALRGDTISPAPAATTLSIAEVRSRAKRGNEWFCAERLHHEHRHHVRLAFRLPRRRLQRRGNGRV